MPRPKTITGPFTIPPWGGQTAEGYVKDPSEQPMMCINVAGKTVVKVYRSGKITYPVYDALGPNPKTVTHDGHWSASGSAILELCQQNADLCTELAAAKQALDDIRKLLVIPSHLDATEATTRILNTIKEDRNTIAALHKEVRDTKERRDIELAAISVAADQNTRASRGSRIERGNQYWTAAYGDVCRAVDREIEHREAKEALQRELEGWRQSYAAERQIAANEAKQCAALGIGGSFARNVALTALSVGPVDVEDLRVVNAVRAERERIMQKMADARDALRTYAGPKPVGFWQRLVAFGDSRIRAHVGLDVLYELLNSIGNDEPFDVLNATRPD